MTQKQASLLFFAFCFGLTTSVFAQSAAEGVPLRANSKAAGPAFDHSIEVDLTWMDRFSRAPGKAGSIYGGSVTHDLSSDVDQNPLTALPERRKSNGGRTLGLTRARAELNWDVDPVASLSLVLRPDFSLLPRQDGDSTGRDFDSRAGGVRQPRPTVELLDAWRIDFKAGAHLSFGIGLWEALLLAQNARPQLLESGMNPQGPEKFSAGRMQWYRDSTLSLSAWVLEGRQDRGMSWRASDESWDTGPEAEDPWLGSALTIDWSPVQATRIGLVAAHLAEQLVDGRVRTTWLQLFAHRNFERLSVFSKSGISIDARWARDDLDTDPGGKLPLSQWNVAISAKLGMVSDLSLTAGLQQGLSENVNPAEVKSSLRTLGSQYDAGLVWQFAPSLTASGMVAHELRRTEKPDGTKTGAFGMGDQTTDNIRRVLLEIRYAAGS